MLVAQCATFTSTVHKSLDSSTYIWTRVLTLTLNLNLTVGLILGVPHQKRTSSIDHGDFVSCQPTNKVFTLYLVCQLTIVDIKYYLRLTYYKNTIAVRDSNSCGVASQKSLLNCLPSPLARRTTVNANTVIHSILLGVTHPNSSLMSATKKGAILGRWTLPLT